jgi:internalin A
MRTRAVFLLVWIPQAEDNATHEHGGMTFRNRPLAWWLSYVRHLAGTDSPVLIVQNQCEEPGDERRTSPLPDQALAAFAHAKELHYSAKTERGRESLDAALREAIRSLRSEQGTVQIGRGRLAVKERLDAMRNADASIPAAERRHRTLTMEAYRGLCADCGDISDPDALLHYLHHSGVVFYQPTVFAGQIVLDQAWALQAVYAVFNRRQCYQQLRYLRGRFTRNTLGQLLWDHPQPDAPQGYSQKQQEHFLSLMESCGIVFVLREGDEEQGIETEYLAPDLLPQRDDLSSDEQLQLHERWNEEADCDELSVSYPFQHGGVMRALMSRIGQGAGMTAIYWQGGLCLYEQKTRSSAMIEEQTVEGDLTDGDHCARITLRAQGERPAELLEMLHPLAEQAIYDAGFRTWETSTDSRATMLRNARSASSASALMPKAVDMPVPASDPSFAHPPRTAKSCAVSYAWPPANADEATKQHYFQPVDALCRAAEAKGIHVLRDVDDLGLNQAITTFMSRLAMQDRVFVILSDKYLRSENCMFEMKEVWRFCQENPESFRERVRVYRLHDAKVHDLDYQLELADWWLDKFNTTKGRIGRLSEAGALAPEQLARFNNIDSFAKLVGKILHYIHDTLRPKAFAEFLKHGLED